MLMLTEEAAIVIRWLIAASSTPGDAGLRISLGRREAGEEALAVAVADGPAVDDVVAGPRDARIYLEPVVAEALDDKVLHAREDGGEVVFLIVDQRRPGVVSPNGDGPAEARHRDGGDAA